MFIRPLCPVLRLLAFPPFLHVPVGCSDGILAQVEAAGAASDDEGEFRVHPKRGKKVIMEEDEE